MKTRLVPLLLCALLSALQPCLGGVPSFRSLWDEWGSRSKGRVLICTNSAKVLTPEEMKRISASHIKSVDVFPDTIRFTLSGGYDPATIRMALKPGYRAELDINGHPCVYRKDELPALLPKTAQYALTDSCFYLTFDLSPEFQEKGEKAWISGFLIADSIPEPGRRYPLRQITYAEGDPIIGWQTAMGEIATLQIAYMPECRKFFPADSLPAGLEKQRIILNSVDITGGYIEITEFKAAKRRGLASLKMRMAFSATLAGGRDRQYSLDIVVSDGQATFHQVQKTDLQPMLFEIDYGWQDSFCPI